MLIVTVVGARPAFIKMALVSRELKKYFNEIIVHTGQHYDYEMDKIFFEELKIPKPGYYLSVSSGSHGYQTAEMLKEIEKVLLKEMPALVLIYGDTNSTLAGALAASKLHIKIGHIEAGMRSFDRSMPEEINRVLVDHCSDFHFCSTKTAVENLKREGVTDEVYLTGDVTVDSLLENKDIAESQSTILNDLNLKSKEYIVATIHRAGNTDNRENLKNIVEAIVEAKVPVVFPVHPRTEKLLKKGGLYSRLDLNTLIKLTKPLGFLDFLKLMNHAKKVLTDSGGIQKEAYILKIPCITVRENTEWVETIEDGWNKLVGTDQEKIIWAVKEFQPSAEVYKERFGNGDASKRIAEIIRERLQC